MALPLRLAIDLGSSNTVAVTRGADGAGRPVLFDGSELLPSAVCLDAAGSLVVGRDAERLARLDPAAYEPHPKRRIDDGTVLLGGCAFDVRDVLAAVLDRAAGPVRRTTSTQVVLTCPAGWAAPRRRVLLDAAQRAGLGAARLVSEPVAAAAYFVDVLGNSLPPAGALAVVDLGAGTADVAVVRRGPTGLDVVAQGGLDVGGADLDAALVDLLVSGVVPAPEPATAAGRRDRMVLWQEVRAAKESLSRISVAPVHVPGHERDVHLTREEVEAVAAPLLAPVADLAARVVAGAGLTPDRLAGVLLVGGGSRIPLLARLLHTRLGVAPTVVERPETVVAEGALHAVAGDEPDEPAPPQPAPAPATPAPAPPNPPRTRKRWLNPAALVLALLCFLMPFATVSCGLPGGYGRAKPSGTTTYTGLDLAVGGTPDVPAKELRPRPERRPDRLPPQPAVLLALLAALGAAMAAFAVPAPRRRRAVVAALCAGAALALLTGQAVVVDLLAGRVRAQSAVPAGKTAHDFVGTGFGFWFALLLLAGAAAANAIGLRRRAPVNAG